MNPPPPPAPHSCTFITNLNYYDHIVCKNNKVMCHCGEIIDKPTPTPNGVKECTEKEKEDFMKWVKSPWTQTSFADVTSHQKTT